MTQQVVTWSARGRSTPNAYPMGRRQQHFWSLSRARPISRTHQTEDEAHFAAFTSIGPRLGALRYVKSDWASEKYHRKGAALSRHLTSQTGCW